MAVVITDRELPYNCINCWNKADCNYYDRYLRDPYFKHPNCPLKSVDEMIKEIATELEKLRMINTKLNENSNGYLTSEIANISGMIGGYVSTIDIIHKYTDK